MKSLKLSSAFVWIALLVVFYFPHVAFADQTDFSASDSGSGTAIYGQALPTGSSGTVSSWTFYDDQPQFWTGEADIRDWHSGFASLTSCTSGGDSGNEATGGTNPCVGRVRHEVDFTTGATIARVGNFITITFPSPITIDSAHNWVFFYGSGDFSTHTGFIHGRAGSPLTCIMMCSTLSDTYWIAGGGIVQGDDTSTRIVSVTPAASSTIATSSSSTFGTVVYVNPADFADGMTVEIKYAHEAEGTLTVEACVDCLFKRIVFPITQSGVSSFSTTSPAAAVGRYVMVTTIRNSSLLDNALQFLGFGQFATLGVKTATTTTFVAGSRNAYDILTDSMVTSINDYLASSTVSFASCTNWTQLSLVDCMNLLFVPQWEPIKQAVDNFRQGFLTYWPWGYITRFAVILSGSATSTLPTFAVSLENVLPPGSPPDTYTLNQNDMLAGAASTLNAIPRRGGSENLQDIAEPMVRTFLAILILMIIIRDLTKIGGNHSSAARRGHV